MEKNNNEEILLATEENTSDGTEIAVDENSIELVEDGVINDND